MPWLKSALDLGGETDREAWLVTTMMYLLNSLMSQPVEDVDRLIARFGEISQEADVDDDPLLCLITRSTTCSSTTSTAASPRSTGPSGWPTPGAGRCC